MQNDANNGSLTDKFRDFGAAPSDGLWDSIATQLDEKKKRRFGFWWWTTGLAATLLLATGIYFYGSDAETSRRSSFARANGERAKNHTTNAPKGEENVRKDGGMPVSPSDTYLHNNRDNRDGQQSVSMDGNGNTGRSIITNAPSNRNVGRMDGTFVNGNETDSLRENVAENGGGVNKADSLKAIPMEITPPENDLALHTDSIRNDSSFGRFPGFPHVDGFSVMPSPKWMIGLHTARWQDNGSEPWSGPPPPGELSTAGAADIFGTPGTNGPYIHRHWSFEADVAYSFRYRWWIGSGVHLGHFASERQTLSAAYTNAQITAWTIGVPFSLNADVISRGRWQVYTGLGLNFDFPLQRKLQYEPGSSATAFSVEESTQPNGYLGSTQLNIGVRCRVWRNLSVDLRPTARRYFENGAPNGVFVYNKMWWGVAGGITYLF